MDTWPRRKSPRLQGYDYAQAGAYFVTICTHLREHLFGKVKDVEMVFNPIGQIALQRWNALPAHHPHIELDAFVVMPNHVHGIVVIVNAFTPINSHPATADKADTDKAGADEAGTDKADTDKAGLVPTKGTAGGSLGVVIGSYKSSVTRLARAAMRDDYLRVWQSRYHDHIIRNEADLQRIREYIATNPARWSQDIFYTNGSHASEG